MRFLLIVLLVSRFASCGSAQNDNSQQVGNSKLDIASLLKPGKHTAEIMDSVLYSPRQIELTKRLQEAIQNNYNWFVDYMKTVPEGQPMPYHKNLGLSKEEYEEFVKIAEDKEITSSGRETLVIIQKEKMISFKGSGRLAILDSLQINQPNNLATFRSFQLKYHDSVRSDDDKNGLKSNWYGHQFKYEDPQNISIEDLRDVENLNLTTFTLTIARLEKNGKTFLDFSGRRFIKGEKTFDFRLPLIIE